METNASTYAGLLRFVAARADRRDAQVAALMDRLTAIAGQIERDGSFTVPRDDLEPAARALAGVAALLHKRILPEAVAAGNNVGESQIRWAVDASMDLMRRLLLATADEGCASLTLTLPAPE